MMLKTDGKIPVIAASDIGGWALAAFKDPETWIGADMKVVSEWVTPRDIAAHAAAVLGEPVHVEEVSEHAWNAMRTPQFEEIWLNLQTFYTAPPDYRDVEMSNKLLPGARKVEDYLKQTLHKG